MNTIQKGIITLLKSAITGQAFPLPEDFVIDEAMPFVREHHMTTLVYDGAARCGISRKEPAMQQLFARYCQAMLKSEGQMRAVESIFAAFEENDIDYLPLKGCKMKPLYPKPELRIMGDADILIRLEQYEKIVPIMERLGFTAKANTDHELIWVGNGLVVELHKRLIPSYNQDFHRYFDDPWHFASACVGKRWSMTPENEWIFLLTHFAKHFRDGGIGCRHVVDLWMFLRTHSRLDEGYIRAELEKLQLQGFHRNIRDLIEVWFDRRPADEKTDFITDFIFASGSWGKLESRVLSVGVRDSGKRESAKVSKLKYLWRMAFPGADTLKFKYKVLQKAPWMLPLVWVYRPFFKLLRERKDVQAHGEKLQSLTAQNLKDRQDALRYMDIDYYF